MKILSFIILMSLSSSAFAGPVCTALLGVAMGASTAAIRQPAQMAKKYKNERPAVRASSSQDAHR